jgi:hypothetical protein
MRLKPKGCFSKIASKCFPRTNRWQRCLAMTSLHLPMRGGDDKPRCPHGNIINHDHGVVGALLPFLPSASQPGTHNSRRHRPHAPAAPAQQGLTPHSTSPSSQTQTRPSSTRKRTRIPDLNVPISSNRHKRRRPPSPPDMLTITPSVTTQIACGPLLPLFPLYPTSEGTPDDQTIFNLCQASNQTQPQSQSPKLSKGNKRPRRVLGLN